MAIKSDSAGGLTTLSFESHIVPEFITDGGLASALRPHSLSEYYVGGTAGVPVASPQNDNIPTSGTIQFSDFYGATAQITLELAAGNISGGSVNLFSLAQTLGGQTPINGVISTPMVFVFPSPLIVYNTIYTGGNFADLIILVESGALVYGRGGNAGQNGNPAISVNASMGSLEIINEGWIASGGNGGSSGTNFGFTTAPTSGQQANIRMDVIGGGGGGEGGGNGGNSQARTLNGDNNINYNPGGGSGNQTGGNGSSGTLIPRGLNGVNDRIGEGQHCSGSGCLGTATGGAGGSGGGRGGASSLAAQSNSSATDGNEWVLVAGGGGGSSRRGQSSGLSGSNGFSTLFARDTTGNKNFKTGAIIANGTGGTGWGSATTISGTGNASSYTYTNNGGTLL